MRTQWKSWGIGLALAALLAGGLFLALPSSDAAVARVVRCTGRKDHVIKLKDGLPVLVQTQGFLDAGIGEGFSTPDGRKGTTLTVEDLASKGTAEGLGDVSFSLDAERTREAGGSSIVANSQDSEFPATQTMQFHFNVTIDGKTYHSVNAATVVSTCVTSLPPKAGTVFTLAHDVEIADENGETVGSLAAGKAFTSGG